jgi:hypothetical protein
MKDNLLLSLQWKLGVIEEITAGTAKIVHVVYVHVSGNVLKIYA